MRYTKGNRTRVGSRSMGKHDVPVPQPDPTRDGHKPGQLPPSREPGKHEEPGKPEEQPGKHETK